MRKGKKGQKRAKRIHEEYILAYSRKKRGNSFKGAGLIWSSRPQSQPLERFRTRRLPTKETVGLRTEVQTRDGYIAGVRYR
jgi:hypothetical protein